MLLEKEKGAERRRASVARGHRRLARSEGERPRDWTGERGVVDARDASRLGVGATLTARPAMGENLNDRSNSKRGLRSMEKLRLRLNVNGEAREVLAPVHHTLLEVLREELNLTGTKHGCELGECGTCTVLLDGQPVLSCVTLPVECQGREVTTVEGMAEGGRLHPLQEAFAELGAAQCGYCTPGFLLVAQALLRENERPSRDEIANATAGNLCRCTGYLKIFEAVELAATRMRGERVPPAVGTVARG
jgi:aerobic-type carbon monoxide dehydrogenase small subunit (CoxS/CutS family)